MKQFIEVGKPIPEREVTNHEIACNAWEAARQRHNSTRAAITECLDNSTRGVAALDFSPRAEEPETELAVGAYARMARRTLLLAEALQQHTLLRIAETGAVLDDIDRTVARSDEVRKD